jgi:hypothetical protein
MNPIEQQMKKIIDLTTKGKMKKAKKAYLEENFELEDFYDYWIQGSNIDMFDLLILQAKIIKDFQEKC